jgi:cyclomaltodextrinase
MVKQLTILFLSFNLLFSCHRKTQSSIKDLIQPIRLIAGKPDTVLVRDLFYADSYPVQFSSNEPITVKYLSQKNQLVLTANPNFEGLTLLEFDFNHKKYELPIRVEIKQKHTFRYHPKTKPKSISVFGQFNYWNREDLYMHDEDDDGAYEIEVKLDPGRYEYKFFVDGKELIDPTNPVKVPNPFGDFNSILVVPPRHTDKAFLHILSRQFIQDTTEFSFYYERENQREPLQNEHIVALINNQRLPENHIQIHGDQINLRFSQNDLRDEKVIRIGVTQQGQSTLIKTIQLHDGKLAGEENTPFSWHDGIIYAIMIDRFFDGDPGNSKAVENHELSPKANYQGGDLRGILRKIQEGYFDSLGVNVLWISPVNDNTDKAYREWPEPHRYFSGYHGYWPIAAERVEERFGDIATLQTLVTEAHSHGIKVLLDFVSNHVHEEHPFFKEHRDWFGKLELPDGRKNIRLWDEYRLTTWFEPFMPSFDYVNSREAREVMTDNAVWWLKTTGADGFRHDAVKHVPNSFWRLLTQKIKKEFGKNDHKIYQIGETFGSYELISSYVNNGQLDGQFSFNLYYTARNTFLNQNDNFRIVADEIWKTFLVYGLNHLMGNLMDSHDQVRYMAFADSDIFLDTPNAAEIGWTNPPQVDHPNSYEKAKLFLTYILTIPGVPIIDYGDEIGMTGAADPDNRRMMRFGDQVKPIEKNMLEDVSQLIHLRRNHSALRYGDFQTLLADESCFAYLRSDFDERILVVLNKSEKGQEREIEIPQYYMKKSMVSLLSGERVSVSGYKLNLKIPALGRMVIKIE